MPAPENEKSQSSTPKITLATAYGMGKVRTIRTLGKAIADAAYGLSQVEALKADEGLRARLIRRAFERELEDFFGGADSGSK